MRIGLFGGTGNLGGRLAHALKAEGAHVRAIVRKQSDHVPGADEEIAVSFENGEALVEALLGVDVVVSALSGLREVIVGAQTQIVNAAVAARVGRFIPSDFAIDYRAVPAGKNRNLDLRRDFRAVVETKKIRATSIHNGAFMDMLLKEAPIVFPKLKRVAYWENPDQRMVFTTMDDTAAFTAKAAMDAESPRDLHIAGDVVSARDLARVSNSSLFRLGSAERLESIIDVLKAFTPNRGQLYPIWQGLQYLDNMFTGEGFVPGQDNSRYGDLKWTRAKDVLQSLERGGV